MPTSTYIALANLTLTGTDTSIVFSSIPATYRDLVLVSSMKVTAGVEVRMRFNNDSSSTYTAVQMVGRSAGVLSNTASGNYAFISPNHSPSTTDFDAVIINIMDYSATDKHKTHISRFSSAGDSVNALAGRWPSTNAINQVEIYVATQSFASGSTFALYGIVS